MKITLLDLGVGNLHSLEKALVRATPGARVEIATDAAAALATELLVLPGVGAFSGAAERLAPARGRVREALEAGLPCLGICLGMQLLFEASDEGPGEGLGLVRGRVTKLRSPRVPHMGWSPVDLVERRASWPMPRAAYYAHSFACRPEDPAVIVATTEIDGDRFPAIVRAKKAVGCQFHPEKSSDEGVALLAAIVAEVTR